jgi:hypothetical protein
MSNFVPIIQFGFDGSNKSQMDLSIAYVETSYGPRHLQGLIPMRRKELVALLRIYADIRGRYERGETRV